MNSKERIKKLLKSVDRDTEEFEKFLEKSGFYKASASRNHHGNYPGGLADHTTNFHALMREMKADLGISDEELSDDNIVVACIVHDVGKLFVNGTDHPTESIQKAKEHIRLERKEKKMIKYHMGPYYTSDLKELRGNYTLLECIDAFEDRIVKLFHYMDDLSSQFMDEKKEDD